jgi:hypothetical protein
MARNAPTVAFATALVIAGCVPNGKSDVRKDAQDGAIHAAAFEQATLPDGTVGVTARLIAPKRCRVSIATLSRPAKEPALNGILWGVADENAVPFELRRVLESNGLRVGLIRGSLPAEVQAIMNAPPPRPRAEVVEIDQPDGEPTYIELAGSKGPMSLLVSRDGHAIGKDYEDAKGALRVTATRDDAGGVRVKVVPEIHHGPVRDAYGAAPVTGPFQPQEFLRKRGQAEESFRDLSTNIALQPGQILALGGAGDGAHGLGGFLFNQADPNSDRIEQRVVLIWAKPAQNTPNPAPSPSRAMGFFPSRDEAATRPARP